VDPNFAQLTQEQLEESPYVFEILEVESAYQEWFKETQRSTGHGPTECQVYEWMLREGSERQKSVANILLEQKTTLNRYNMIPKRRWVTKTEASSLVPSGRSQRALE